MKDFIIRQETPADFTAVREVLKLAFVGVEYSDQQEYLLVERLRTSPAFVPALSLVAEVDNKVVGHILLSKIKIVNAATRTAALALAPVSVHPDHQGKGIGGALIRNAHERARTLGYESVVLLGHAGYYPRFGYRPCQDFGITLPFPAPAENCMVLELKEGALNGVTGMVEYPAAFFAS